MEPRLKSASKTFGNWALPGPVGVLFAHCYWCVADNDFQ